MMPNPVPEARAPTKAYYVERFYRAKTLFRVDADSVEDAKQRHVMEGEAIDSETLGETKVTARRMPAEDRHV